MPNMQWDWFLPLLTLSVMEIVLGIDNIIFIAILAGKLPPEQQPKARQLGLMIALGTRLLLLFTLSFILGLTAPLFHLSDLGLPFEIAEEADAISLRDLILLAGGMFLIAKSTFEIHDKLEGPEDKKVAKVSGRFGAILVQIAILDIVFSLDSVITAVGMARQLWVMVVAMIIAVGVMLVFAGPISDFVHRHPTLKILALSFLILIGVMLVAEGLGQHINKGYIYFAMAFSVVVEMLNLRLRARATPVHLHEPHIPGAKD
jgi:predicted tellurium resistance membrane protein TerC